MTVTSGDALCRFVDPKYWFADEDRPAASAFRASNHKLSTWHCDRVAQQDSRLEDLCFASLDECGEALLTANDFLEAADQTPSPVFQPNVVWRPEEAPGPWGAWRDAHVNVEAEAGNASFPLTYRELLAKRCEVPRRPHGV